MKLILKSQFKLFNEENSRQILFDVKIKLLVLCNKHVKKNSKK